jgi:hypothetical protein
MDALTTILGLAAGGAIAAAGIAAHAIRRRNMQHWLGECLRQQWRSRRSTQDGTIHVLICIADHFEPAWGNPSQEKSDERVAAWLEEYPKNLGRFRDSDGRPPQHTFFYPIDQYNEKNVDAIAELCTQGFGEVEIHLHHDNDTAENLEGMLSHFVGVFADRHGLLGRWADGSPAYGFVHGNWALDNSRPDGKWCGVTNELAVLQRTGCYADFTLPSAPDATQTRTINEIYYAEGRDGCCKAHDRGTRVVVGGIASGGLMIVQGPLRLWRPRGSLKPRIENGCVQAGQPATMERLDQWIKAGVRVAGREDWVFVKLHTHGAKESNRRALLGEAGMAFHEGLARRAAQDMRFRYHYVTAREMFNLAKNAESGWTGSVDDGRNHLVSAPERKNCPAISFSGEKLWNKPQEPFGQPDTNESERSVRSA